MKHVKTISAVLAALLVLGGCAQGTGSALPELPAPEFEEGLRGEQFGIDKNINEATIDQYLFRDDAVYRDMRMLRDEAEYEAIGGDSWLSGIVEGFEVVPYPYLCNVEGLPEAVGQGYHGETLFTHDENGYTANYEESMDILEYLFPKDKVIFLMCGGGGYAGMTKNMLVELGWDETKIYNVGGYWYYDGDNKVETKYSDGGSDHYDFSIVNYHNIDFLTLTPIAGSKADKQEDKITDDLFIEITSLQQLEELEKEGKTFALYVYLPGCVSCASFAPIVREFTESNQIDMYAVDLTVLAKTKNSVSDRVSYTPSMFIYENGEVKAYLDPGSNDDLPYYQTLEGLSSWFAGYLDIDVLHSETVSQIDDCDTACSLT